VLNLSAAVKNDGGHVVTSSSVNISPDKIPNNWKDISDDKDKDKSLFSLKLTGTIFVA